METLSTSSWSAAVRPVRPPRSRHARPAARSLVLDRADFPRDKVCGDGIAPEALDVLAGLGVDPAALTEGYPPVPRLRLRSPGGTTVERAMHRPASVVPREVFDARLLTAALAAGAELRRHTVRRIEVHADARRGGRFPHGGRRRRGGRRGVRRPPGARAAANRPAAHRDRHPRLRTGSGRRPGRAGHRHDRAALARLRVVLPAGRRPGERRLRGTGLQRRHPRRAARRARRPAARRRARPGSGPTGCRCPPAGRGCPTGGCCSPGTPPR